MTDFCSRSRTAESEPAIELTQPSSALVLSWTLDRLQVSIDPRVDLESGDQDVPRVFQDDLKSGTSLILAMNFGAVLDRSVQACPGRSVNRHRRH